MTCPDCGAQNDADNRFCERCGAALDAVQARVGASGEPLAAAATSNCASCGAPNHTDNRFCERCGSVLATAALPAPAVPAAARAEVTEEPPAQAARPALADTYVSPGPVVDTRDQVVTGKRRGGLVAVAIVVSLLALTASVIAIVARHAPTSVATPGPTPSATVASPSAPPSSPSFTSLFATEHSGVVQIVATSCGGSDIATIGTGFLIRPDLVATVNHVVANPVTIAMSVGTETRTGTVVGFDPSAELALVRADRPFSGYVFSLAPSAPQVGDAVAAMGYPEGLPLTFTQGTVSGLDRQGAFDGGATLSGLIQTDTALNHGNSGGPLIDASGQVVGLVEGGNVQAQGISFAVGAASAAPAFKAWEQSEIAQPPATCSNPIGPPGGGDIPSPPSDPDGAAMAATIVAYHNAINAGDYQMAWEQFTPAEQQRVSVDHLAKYDATSFGFDIQIHQITKTGPAEAIVYTTFTSIQSPGYGPNGETCDHWTLDYVMQRIGSRWLIDGADPHDGSTHTPC